MTLVKGLMAAGSEDVWRMEGAFRPREHSTVLAMSRTLRAGARRRGRYAASWTSPARGALPAAGRDGEMTCSVERRIEFG